MKITIRKPTFTFYLAIVIFIIFLLFLPMLFLNKLFNNTFPDTARGPRKIMEIFIKLDYLGNLAEKYMWETGLAPEGEMNIVDALKTLHNGVKIDDPLQSPYDIRGYVLIKGNFVDYSDFTTILADRYLSLGQKNRSFQYPESIEQHLEGEEDQFLLGGGDFSFKKFMEQTDGKFVDNAGYLYIGCEKSNYYDEDYQRYERELVNIITAMREDYYFSDSDGTPYNGGNAIFIRVKISPEVKNN